MPKDYFNLKGKVALVTGASSGLGCHFANILADEGAVVILAARRADKLAEKVKLIRGKGGVAHAVAMDVTNPESVSQAFANIEKDHQSIDILINNAGVASEPKKFLDTSETDWNWVVDTNLNGAWRVAKAAAELMIKTKSSGNIVNIASVYGLRTGALKVAYNVSKTGIVQLTKSMSIELCRYGIRVNSLCPGWFATDLNSKYFETDSGKRYIKTIPSQRLGQMNDLTVPLLLLASNSAGDYITGSSLTVDGGIQESPI